MADANGLSFELNKKAEWRRRLANKRNDGQCLSAAEHMQDLANQKMAPELSGRIARAQYDDMYDSFKESVDLVLTGVGFRKAYKSVDELAIDVLAWMDAARAA